MDDNSDVDAMMDEAIIVNPADELGAAVAQFRNSLSVDFDFGTANSALRQLKKLRKQGARSANTARVAVLGKPNNERRSGTTLQEPGGASVQRLKEQALPNYLP